MEVLVRAAPQLASGLLITLAMTIGAMIVAACLAVLAGLARTSRFRVLRLVSLLYIEFFRGTAALVQLYWLYYALPLIGIVLPAGVVGIGGLGLCMGAYSAEVVRASVTAVGRGQTEAALSLGLRTGHALWLVVLPQAFRIMLPQAAVLSIELLKASSLVSLITLHDLTFEAQQLNAETYQTAKIFILILVVYYLLAALLTKGFSALEKSLQVGAPR